MNRYFLPLASLAVSLLLAACSMSEPSNVIDDAPPEPGQTTFTGPNDGPPEPGQTTFE